MNDYEKIKKSKIIAQNILRIMKKEEDGSHSETIQELLEGNRDAEKFIENISNESYLHNAVSHYTNPNKQERADQLYAKMNHKRQKSAKRLRYTISSVAAALVFVSFVLFQTNHHRNTIENDLKNENSAILIFEDGSRLPLNSDSKGDKKNLIIQNSNKRINYTNYIANDKEEFHTLITPAKCTYTLILSDSTEVLLNAGSKIRYPRKFVQNTREIYLEGEAYFKVTKSTQPFVVASKDFNIKVYGTVFNVNTTKNKRSEAVLLSGSIGVTLKKGDGHEIMISPNQLFTLETQSGNYKVTEVDCNRYIGWTSGAFIAENIQLSSLLDDIARWYGIEYRFADPAISNTRISVDMNMSLEINQVNSILESLINRVIINEGDGKYRIK